MPPTTYPEQYNKNANFNFGSQGPIPVAQMTEPVTPVRVPPLPQENPNAFSLDAILASFNAPAPQEEVQSDLRSRITSTLDKLGTQSARKGELEATAGLPGQRTELQGVINQLQTLAKENAAIPLQIQEEFKGRGVTRAGVAPIEASRLRENTIKALGLSAIGQTLQGNIQLAEANIAEALDREFEPEQRKLDILKQFYEFNRDDLERYDKKRTDTLNIVLAERERILKEQRADKEEIYQIGRVAVQNGASPSVAQKIMASSTRAEALSNAGSFLQDPKAIYEIENLRLSNLLTKEKIATEQKQRALMGEKTEKELKEEAQRIASSKTRVSTLEDKMLLIDGILKSPGLSTAVGPSAIGRGKSIFGIPAPDSIIANLTGRNQAFVGSVRQLTSQEFLDAVLKLKAEGGTLGQLTEREGAKLQAAATKISEWEVENGKGQVIGYNVSEAEFIKEINQIRQSTERILSEARGSTFSSDEASLLDVLYSTNSFNPAF